MSSGANPARQTPQTVLNVFTTKPKIDKTTSTTQDRNIYSLEPDDYGKQCMRALKQSESSPSNDHVKHLAATLLHNKRLFIFSLSVAALFGGEYL